MLQLAQLLSCSLASSADCTLILCFLTIAEPCYVLSTLAVCISCSLPPH